MSNLVGRPKGEASSAFTVRLPVDVLEFVDLISANLHISRNSGLTLILRQCAVEYSEALSVSLKVSCSAGTACLCYRAPADVVSYADGLAAVLGVTRNAVIVLVIRQYLADHPAH